MICARECNLYQFTKKSKVLFQLKPRLGPSRDSLKLILTNEVLSQFAVTPFNMATPLAYPIAMRGRICQGSVSER